MERGTVEGFNRQVRGAFAEAYRGDESNERLHREGAFHVDLNGDEALHARASTHRVLEQDVLNEAAFSKGGSNRDWIYQEELGSGNLSQQKYFHIATGLDNLDHTHLLPSQVGLRSSNHRAFGFDNGNFPRLQGFEPTYDALTNFPNEYNPFPLPEQNQDVTTLYQPETTGIASRYHEEGEHGGYYGRIL